MNESDIQTKGDLPELKLSRRDWMLLPLICLLTICLTAGSAEMIGTWMFPRAGNKNTMETCIEMKDKSTGGRGIPNSVCWNGLSEGSLVEYRLNGCGHRTSLDCRSKPAGSYRIVLFGSSFVFGLGVPIESTFAELLAVKLSNQTGRKIEVYNAGTIFGYQTNADLRSDEILAAHPDMILWLIGARDVRAASENLKSAGGSTAASNDFSSTERKKSYLAEAWESLKYAFANKSLSQAFSAISKKSRAVFLVQHLVYRSQSLYVKSYLQGGDDAGAFQLQPSPEWQGFMEHFESYTAELESRANSAGVPFVAVMVPERVQADMISMGVPPTGYSPFNLDNELRNTITSHGGTYLEILSDFRNVANAGRNYLPVDAHPTADGDMFISGFLANALTGGAIPALKRAVQHQVVLEQKR
jgi:hypothetical protein